MRYLSLNNKKADMNKEGFIAVIKEELEIEDVELNDGTRFDSLEIWDSMSRLILISLVDEQFHLQLKDSDFKNMPTFKDLIIKIGEDRFEDSL